LIAVDSNILVHAHRSESKWHEVARTWRPSASCMAWRSCGRPTGTSAAFPIWACGIHSSG